MSYSVLIVDDEPLARCGVALRLQAHTDLKVIAECANGREAVSFILQHKPDLVFLDIQMPVMNGLDVVRALPPDVQPFIIFLTAFDQYVMRAFEVHAIDYLLKPIDEERFAASLLHARRVLEGAAATEYNKRFRDVLNDHEAPLEVLREFAIRTGKQVHFVPVDEVDWIEAQGDYAEIHTAARTHLIRESLNALEAQLDASSFVRIHRSAIVRVHRIASVRSLPNRDCAVTLRSGVALRVSRTYSEHLRTLLRKRALQSPSRSPQT